MMGREQHHNPHQRGWVRIDHSQTQCWGACSIASSGGSDGSSPVSEGLHYVGVRQGAADGRLKERHPPPRVL